MPNLAISEPKNKFIIAVVTNLKVSLMENALLLKLRASVMAVRYRVEPLEQKPRLIQMDKKQMAIIIQL